MLSRCIRAASAAALFLCATTASAEVLDVDASAGPFFSIRDAASAAVDGDLIRVRAGTYGWFGIIGKGVSVVGIEPGVVVDGTIRIQNLPSGSLTQIANLTAWNSNFGEAVLISHCGGSVRIERVDARGSSTVGVEASIRIEHSQDVALTECATAASFFLHGAIVRDSSASFFDCELNGGYGRASGLHAEASAVLVEGGTVKGGSGTSTFDMCDCTDGGPALSADMSTVVVIDSQLDGGWTGSGSWPLSCYQHHTPCNDGPESDLTATATLHRTDTSAPSLSASTPIASEGETVTFEAAGQPGALLALLPSLLGTTIVRPGFEGNTLIQAPQGGRRVILGSAPAAGQITWDYVVPQLPISVHVALHVQIGQFDAIEGLTLGPSRVIHLVDSGL